MKSKKEKTLSEKFNEAKPNSSIELTAKDRANQWRVYKGIIKNYDKERLNFWFLCLGLVFGITGSYISTQIYDFSRNILLSKHGFDQYVLFNIFIWLIFGIISTIFVLKIRSMNKQTKELRQHQRMWSNAGSIHIGEIYPPEYLENSNRKIKNEIRESVFWEIKKKNLSIKKISKNTNLPKDIIKNALKELIEINAIRLDKILFWKRYKIKENLGVE